MLVQIFSRANLVEIVSNPGQTWWKPFCLIIAKVLIIMHIGINYNECPFSIIFQHAFKVLKMK